MKLFGRDLDTEVCLVAEIGSNHEGSKTKALFLAEEACLAGADAVKFQSYTTEILYEADDPRFEQAKRFELADEALLVIAEQLPIPVFASAITHDKVPFLAENFEAIKIASGDVTHKKTLQACAATEKPILISAGMATYNEMLQADYDLGDREDIIWMHCVSAYPCPIEDTHIGTGMCFMEEFSEYVGYSNHTPGISACLSAIACNASVVEVHFTDKKRGLDFRDHALSCDYMDLIALRNFGDEIKLTLADGADVQDCEKKNRRVMRKNNRTNFRFKP